MFKVLCTLLLASVACAGQAVSYGSPTVQGGWTMPIANPLVSLNITPPSATLTDGSGTQYTATGVTALGTTSDFTQLVTWSSSNNSIASFVGNVATCTGVGTIVVKAQTGLIQQTSSLNCQAPAATGAHNEYCRPDGTWIGSGTDGPASLPSTCYFTALSGTPSNGTVRGPVSTLSALQTAYAAAACGDVIQITAGSSITGPWVPAAKNCPDSAYITIESTGISNSSFPPEGTRLFPCQSNIASLPNRPSYPCTSPALLTAQFVAPASNNAVTMNGTDHIRFIGIEFTRISTPGAIVFNLVDLGSQNPGTQTHHIVFDRTWFHGINADGQFPQLHSVDTSTTRGLYLAQSNHIAVIDSYLSDFYDNGGGDGGVHGSANGNSDAQCIAGGNGTIKNSGWGVYKFVNDHCEGSAEGILLGGDVGPALTPNGCTIGVNCNIDVPSDIEVRLDYFFKPQSWNGNTTTVNTLGWPVVKNGFEMKTGARALFEGNLIENTWYSAQVGYCWSTAPKNQSTTVGGVLVGSAPTALTNDFTYRYNYCYNAAYGIALYQSMDAGCNSCQAQGANRISIHDNVIGDNLNLGNLTSISAGDETEFYAAKDTTAQGLNKLQNVSILHNTFVKGIRALTIFGADATGQMSNWTFQNNIWHYASNGFGDIGNPAGCDTSFGFSDSAKGILDACVTTYTFDHNAVFNWNGGTLGSKWPTDNSGAGNFFFNGTSTIGFSSYGTGDSLGNPNNYVLTNASTLHNAGSDGKDVGADIGTMVTKLTNVRDSPSQQFVPGNLVIYPSSATVELGTKVPFACDNNGNTTCTWTIQSGVGSIDSKGNYTAPNSSGSAVIQAINGANLVTANITVSGTTPAATGDCATVPYAHSGAVENNCHMTHTETVGTATRNWEVVIPANYVAGQSGLIVHFGTSHGLHATNDDPCGPPTNEIAGWNPYLQTVPSPAPVLVCPEAVFQSSLVSDIWNWLGDNQVTWTGSVVPNDDDFIRQLILITVRDLNLNPKAVFLQNSFDAQGWEGGMAIEAAAVNSDLVAGVGVSNENAMNLMDSTFTVQRSAAPHFGQKLNAPVVPVSVISETGVQVLQSSVYAYICGLSPTTFPSSNGNYHPLTIDDTFRFWNQTDHTTTTVLQPNNVGSSFCTGTYDGSGNGLSTTLEVRKDTGGKLGTAIYAYKLVGNASKAVPWCSFNWNGGDTLGCNNGTTGSFVAMDFRNTTCTFSQPCNHFLDAGTGPASASGYDTLGIYYRFFFGINGVGGHPKP